MRSKLRRFEALLPTRFNDGREVPDETTADALGYGDPKCIHALSCDWIG